MEGGGRGEGGGREENQTPAPSTAITSRFGLCLKEAEKKGGGARGMAGVT